MIHSIFCGIVRIFSVEVEGVDTVDTEEAEDEGTVDFGRMSGGEVHAEAGTGAGMKFEVEAETEVEVGAEVGAEDGAEDEDGNEAKNSFSESYFVLIRAFK